MVRKEKRRFNLLFVADVSTAKVIGGAERVLYEQSTRLAQRGHNVHILTRRLPIHENDQDTIKGVTEWRYNHKKDNPILFLYSTYANGKRLFESLYHKYNYDCVNFQQPFSALGITQSPLSKNLTKIYTCHSLSYEEFLSRNGRANGLLRKFSNLLNSQGRKWIEKKVLNQSDVIIALSEFTKKKLFDVYKIGPHNVLIIPGGIDLEKFNLTENKLGIRKKLNMPPDKVILLTIRNLVNRMGLENLIIALKNIVRYAPDIFLVIGGEGPLKDHLTALTHRLGLNDFIHFAGFVPEDQLPSYYQMADLFVLPTKELEGFGLVTLEALASGLPVIGTPVGGTKEILSRFNPKFIFENIGPESISKKVLEKYKIIKENQLKWEEISHQCRNFIEHNYSWEKNVDSLEELFARKIRYLGYFSSNQ